mgnify:CR=1 FL=1
MNFPLKEYLSSYVLLDFFREKKESSYTGIFSNYFISILEDIIATNYGLINSIGNIMNNSLYESFILLFGPIIFIISMSILSFLNNF